MGIRSVGAGFREADGSKAEAGKKHWELRRRGNLSQTNAPHSPGTESSEGGSGGTGIHELNPKRR